MTVIDTHVHFWNVGTLRYPWIAAGSLFDRTFSPQDYPRASAAAAHADIGGMVFIEADADSSCALQEARWVAELAAGEPRIRAIVARASLATMSAVASDLDALAAIPLVKGIRDNIQGHKEGFAIQPSFVAGVREIGRRGLHFELCVKHQQLGETLQLARLCPEVSLVLDHCAKPDIRNGEREPWLTGIRQLAALPNIVCKISGLATEADPERWQPEDLLWYARQAADAFGPTRILFGSDWPVCEAAGGFAKWFSVMERLTERWSSGERASFFAGNAERIYRLRCGD
ncbi:MAG: amidohydrolase family protein [Steroidobacteraceae bacterium]